MIQYPTVYKDKNGEITTLFYSDGSSLKIQLRETDFESYSFTDLETKETDTSKLLLFEFTTNSQIPVLTHCEFTITIPTSVDNNTIKEKADLLIYAKCCTDFGPYKEANTIQLQLKYTNETYYTKDYDDIETALIQLQLQLPTNRTIMNCLSCKYSNYHPLGNDMFGTLYCFKKIKDKTEKIKDKYTLMEIWDIAYKEDQLIQTQETFICNEYQPTHPDKNWNYKSWSYEIIQKRK